MKNPKVQVLRALAIIAVVIIHACPVGEIQVFVRPFLNFAVATFLFLSGYLTDVSKINTKQFYKKRITRVLIPYAIWSIIYTTIGLITSGEMDIKKYLINFLTAGGAPTLYYIFVYIQFVLLTPFLGKLLHKSYWWVGLLVAPVSLLIKYYWLISGTSPNKAVSILWGVCCLGWFTFYYLGLYFKNKVKTRRYNINRLAVIYLVTLGIQMAEGYWWYLMGETNCGTQLKYSAILSSSVFLLMAYYYLNNKRIQVKSKALVLIGDYSFGIYLAHIMVMTLLKNVLPFWTATPFIINAFVVLCTTLVLVVVSKKILGDKIGRYLGLC